SYKLAIEDAQVLVNLDSNFDGQVTWQEIKKQESYLANSIKSNLSIKNSDEMCSLTLKPMHLEKLKSNTYLHFGFVSRCLDSVETLNLNYTLLFNKDSLHKAYVNIEANDKTHNILFTEDELSAVVDLKASSLWETFIEFIEQGIIHIFIGIDHILFLVALLLPSVLFLHQGKWRANSSFKNTFVNVLKVVTAFTIAHSITLTLTIFGFISLPSWVVESFIAFSVILAAINNLTGTIEKRLWVLVFVFGLIHGMGFASVLLDLELDQSALAISLLGFNIGVELGQIAIVSLLVPLIFFLRKAKWYVPFVLYFGSFLIVLVSAVWLYDRVTQGLAV
ncbi:MAG: putative membrane protein, partial [uncultured Sulfurovum sp.]